MKVYKYAGTPTPGWSIRANLVRFDTRPSAADLYDQRAAKVRASRRTALLSVASNKEAGL